MPADPRETVGVISQTFLKGVKIQKFLEWLNHFFLKYMFQIQLQTQFTRTHLILVTLNPYSILCSLSRLAHSQLCYPTSLVLVASLRRQLGPDSVHCYRRYISTRIHTLTFQNGSIWLLSSWTVSDERLPYDHKIQLLQQLHEESQ